MATARQRRKRAQAQRQSNRFEADAGHPSVLPPTPERGQHDPIRREVVPLDAQGERGVAWRAVDTIGLMLARGTISREEHAACERFRAAFYAARLDPLIAPDVGRIPGQGRPEHLTARLVHAREEVHRVIRELGGMGTPCAEAIWWVVGAEYTCAAFARRMRFSTSRSMSDDSAERLLRRAVPALAAVYDAIGEVR